MKQNPESLKWFVYRPLWWFIILLLLLRIPTFNRPLSKHDDFTNAVLLINAISWQQAGGGKAFYLTPLMNFQGSENKMLEKGPHIDKKGNHVYLSYGAGWYLLPYLVFSALQLPPTGASLELINIIAGLISVLLLFRLLRQITSDAHVAFAATALFALLPSPLWYTGHSYVNTGIMLPLLLGWLHWWYKCAISTSALSWRQYVSIFIATLLLTYFDWIGVFLPAGLVLWSIFHEKKTKQRNAIILTAGMAALFSVFLILYQFTCHLGWEQVLRYWQSRFVDRSIQTVGSGWAHSLKIFLRFFLPGYGPLSIVILAASLSKQEKHKVDNWIWYALGITLLYNLVFLNWSLEHEFAWMVCCVLAVVWLTVRHKEWLASASGKRIVAIAAVISLLAYFLVNPPGPTSRNGEPYNLYQELGKHISQSVPAEAVIFTNVSNAKITEWYARRTFNQARSMNDARRIADSLQLPKAVWMELRDNRIVELKPIN